MDVCVEFMHITQGVLSQRPFSRLNGEQQVRAVTASLLGIAPDRESAQIMKRSRYGTTKSPSIRLAILSAKPAKRDPRTTYRTSKQPRIRRRLIHPHPLRPIHLHHLKPAHHRIPMKNPPYTRSSTPPHAPPTRPVPPLHTRTTYRSAPFTLGSRRRASQRCSERARATRPPSSSASDSHAHFFFAAFGRAALHRPS